MLTPDSSVANGSPVLVTGASGFIALHLVLRLLSQGLKVRGTLRTPSREAGLRDALHTAGANVDNLEFITADLERDDGWAAAFADVKYAFHVASPIPSKPLRDQRALLGPAVDGTVRVLKAAHAQGTQRVVLTSSISAIFSGHSRNGSRTYTEEDWSKTGPKVPAYDLSKTLAERAAWEYVAALPPDRPLELAAINPGFVFGPPLESDFGTTNLVIQKLIEREIPGIPRLGCAPVDVRDIADAHYRAMFTAGAAGQRFCCVNPHLWYSEVAEILAQHGYDVPKRRVPKWLFRLVALFDEQTRVVLPELGLRWDLDASKAKRILGWQPRPVTETILETAAKIAEMRQANA
jgi:nucleoside-diphosphate-sugar epimerase